MGEKDELKRDLYRRKRDRYIRNTGASGRFD